MTELGTSTVSDALDWAGANGQLLGLKTVRPGLSAIGRAYTVRYEAAGPVPGTVGDFIDDVPAGGVVVIQNNGRTDVTVWGDLMTSVASARGVAATVIDGVHRDFDRADALSYPIYSRGNYMRTGKDRVQIASVENAVTISGCLVHAGDLIIADSDGVVVVPRSLEAAVLERAWAIHEAEDAIRDAITAGKTLKEARAAVGYHTLQTRVKGLGNESGGPGQ